MACESCCMLVFYASYILHVRFRTHSFIGLQGFCQKRCRLFDSDKTSSLRSRAEPLDCLEAAASKCQNIHFTHCCAAENFIPERYYVSFPVRLTGHGLLYNLIYIIPRRFYCICDIMFRIRECHINKRICSMTLSNSSFW